MVQIWADVIVLGYHLTSDGPAAQVSRKWVFKGGRHNQNWVL